MKIVDDVYAADPGLNRDSGDIVKSTPLISWHPCRNDMNRLKCEVTGRTIWPFQLMWTKVTRVLYRNFTSGEHFTEAKEEYFSQEGYMFLKLKGEVQ